jgi:hypothetical protein
MNKKGRPATYRGLRHSLSQRVLLRESFVGTEFASLERFLFGAEAKVGRFWIDRDRGSQWHKVLLTGLVDDISDNEMVARLTIISDVYADVSVGPARSIRRLCQALIYKGFECGSTSALPTCPRTHELGVYVCGGRGRFSRNTPNELRAIPERRGFGGEALARASRLTAKIDNSANCGLLSDLSPQLCCNRSEWVVVRQGLNDTTGMARRYHWQSASAHDFVAELHNAASPDQPSRNASSLTCS